MVGGGLATRKDWRACVLIVTVFLMKEKIYIK